MAASAMAHDTSVPRVVGLTTAVCHGPPTQASVPVLTRIELRLRKWREGTPDLGGGVGGDVQARAGHSSYQNERALAIFHGDVIQHPSRTGPMGVERSLHHGDARPAGCLQLPDANGGCCMTVRFWCY